MLTRGRLPSPQIEIIGIRELTPADLGVLREKRTLAVATKFRDPHHALARMIASGLKVNEAAERAGYSAARAYVLHADPSFQDLVASYRKDVNEVWKENVDDFQRLAVSNMLKAERQLAEKLDSADEQGELLPTRDLIAIARDAADRFGYGKKNTNLNINVDFAAKLEAARARSDSARAARGTPPLIEGNLVRRI